MNGEDVAKGQYPWMLSLEVLDPEFRHTCGASLLGKDDGYTYPIETLSVNIISGMKFQSVRMDIPNMPHISNITTL